jgi:cytochrome c oxidase subunit III
MATLDAAHEAAEVNDPPLLSEQFDDLTQQHDTSVLGMWCFLATEVLFFGGLIVAYSVYRSIYPHEIAMASRKLNVLLGGLNTAVLLTSSLTMALAVRASQLRQHRQVVQMLLLTMVLGAAFLGIKLSEWYHDYEEHLIPGASFDYAKFPIPSSGDHGAFQPKALQMFFVLYFIMTGMHAFHMIVGLVLVGVMAYLCHRRWFSGGGQVQVEVAGLYWHFVDIVWIFLYPLLYLIEVRS